MLLKVMLPAKYLLLFTVLSLIVGLTGCSKETSNTVNVEYQLETSDPTADHFYVTYLDKNADTVVQHQHSGWKHSLNVTKPFNAYLQAQVHPINKYVFTIKILIDGQVVQQDSATITTGAKKTIRLAYTAN
jgi:hypothetical protein